MNNMALYQYSWLILLAPLFSFAVIIFGTRVWDMLSRPHPAGQEDALLSHGEHSVETHADIPVVEFHDDIGLGETHPEADSDVELLEVPGPHGEKLLLESIEDPKVPHLTTGALVSGYLGIAIVGLSCLYSWLLLLTTAGVLPIAPPLPAGGITLFSYDWLRQATASYVIAFHLDNLAIAMTVVVTTVSFLVHFYSQGYMENSAGYARFFAYLSLFTFSMLDITFAENFLVMFVGWELVGLSSYLLIGFWINKKAKPNEDRLSPASASIEAFIANRVGDVGFIIGIMILFATTGTFTFSELAARVPQMDKGLLTLAMIIAIYRKLNSVDVGEIDVMKW